MELIKWMITLFLYCVANITLLATNSVSSKCRELNALFIKYCDKAQSAVEPDSILFYTDTCISISNEVQDIQFHALSLVLRSRAFIKKQMFFEAIEVLNVARELYSQDNNIIKIASINLQLANVYSLNQEPEKSEDYYTKAKNGFKELGDTLRYAGTTLNLGELYRNRKWNKKALEHFVDAYWLYKKIDYPMGIAYAQGNIGLVYIEEGKTDSAQILLQQAIDSLRPMGDNYAVSCYIDGLAKIEIHQGNFSKAEAYSKESFQLAEAYGLKEQCRDACLTLSQINEHRQNYKEAYYYHSKYLAYRDSINNEEVIRKIANQKAEYEVAQKQQEMEKQEHFYLLWGSVLLGIIMVFVLVGIYIIRTNAQKRRIRLQLVQQRNELQKANDTKNKFFSILSHDLRNPIAMLNNCTEVLNMSMQDQEYEQAAELVNEMDKSSSSLVQLLDNLLQWGTVQMENIKINRRQVNVYEVVNEELAHLTPVAQVKNIAIHENVAQTIQVFADKHMLAMVIRNLVSNAIKFTPADGEITIGMHQEEAYTVLTIKDTGIGFNALEFKQKMCNKEVESTFGTNNEKGIGLGLQLVCSFVESHQLTFDVKSQPGKGSTFFIYFPK